MVQPRLGVECPTFPPDKVRDAHHLVLSRFPYSRQGKENQTVRQSVRARLEQGCIMLNPTSGCLRNVALAVALAVLAGCGGPAPAPPPVAPLGAAQAAARTQVPLTRPVALDKPGVIADLEFDLPPPGELAWSSLIIGVRIEGTEVKSFIAHSALIVRGGLPARVHLERIEGEERSAVPLIRIGPDLRERIPLGQDGFTPGVKAAGLDGTMLYEAGLEREGMLYDVLSFARAAEPRPGRYHLRVELLEQRPRLQGRPAELIIGYNARAK